LAALTESVAARPVDADAPRPLRVLQVTGALYPGGAESVVVALAKESDEARVRMEVCCTLNMGPLVQPLEESGIAVHRAGPSGRLHNYLRPWHVRQVIKTFKPDIVHTHGLPGLMEIGQLAMLGQAPRWVHTYHYGNYPYKKKRSMTLERMLSPLADQLVAVSEQQREVLIQHHRLDPARIITIPNGVAANPFVGDGRTRRALREALGIASGSPVIGTVAVFTEQKGLTYFLQAAGEVHRVRPDVRFVIVGSGPLESVLRKEAADLDLSDAVIFTGFRSDVPQLLTTFDIFVMSSLWEAMPLALLEAMAARLPIVVTDVGQNKRVVRDGAGGVVVAPRDAHAIAEASLRFLANPDEAARLSAAAAAIIDEQYTTRHMIDRYQATYRSAASSVRRPGRVLEGLRQW
jgi:glycosyltransferase involved in cell wall biosynthesis